VSDMTRRDRDDLAKLVRRREKLAKAEAAKLAAERMADFEAQLAAKYDLYDEAWAEATAKVQEAVRELNEEISRELAERGVPKEFHAQATTAWYSRGENATASRRVELRAVARTRIAALEKTAKAEIERASVEVQTQLVAGGLESDEAKAFLESMPTAEALMPTVAVGDVEAEAEELSPGERRRLGRGW
jgi:hypothetical protein